MSLFSEFNISNHNAITEINSCAQPDVCRDLQKAILDGLDQKVISHRGGGGSSGVGVGSSYNLLLNADLLDRISLDILRMSAHEPSGLNGCRLRTRVERQHSADMDLGCVRIDRDTKETFEIVLSLRERRPQADETEKQSQSRVKANGVASLLSSVFFGHAAGTTNGRSASRVRQVEVLVSDAYQLEKIKLRRFSDDNNIASNVGLCSA